MGSGYCCQCHSGYVVKDISKRKLLHCDPKVITLWISLISEGLFPRQILSTESNLPLGSEICLEFYDLRCFTGAQ